MHIFAFVNNLVINLPPQPCSILDRYFYLPGCLVYNCCVFRHLSYIEAGCNVIKLILKNFAQVIKSNMAAPPSSLGADLVREERYATNFFISY